MRNSILLILLLFPIISFSQSDCENATTVLEGQYTADAPETWYSFTPDSTGEYEISTCGLSSCDTKIYVYSFCTGLTFSEGNLNTIAYNDDACGGLQSVVNVILLAGSEYFIRIGDYNTACSNQSITWELTSISVEAPLECESDEILVQVVISPDNYPYEISWDIKNSDGTLLIEGEADGSSICVDSAACLIFSIYDSYGDGILGNGGYWLHYDNELIANNGSYGYGEMIEMGCPPGFSCLTAVEIDEGFYTTEEGEYWYVFEADSTGTYEISTCYDNDCDTKIWLYNTCFGINASDDYVGTTYFSDNEGGCDSLAKLHAIFEVGEVVYIRIGGTASCDLNAIEWSVNYDGPVVGCMDSLSCNYNPLATVSDTCYFPGDSLCLDGPDLTILHDELVNSMVLGTTTASFCDVEEQCVTGMGQRDLIRFSTWIANIGNIDYYIGDPVDNPDQFDFENCHGHTHYKGYAEYILYDTSGVPLPVGFKNGFCVMDISCWDGEAKYGCSNMGITAGCADIYGAGTSCNWIDVTDIPDGTYTFVARTNWDQSPDALGRMETDFENNWTQVCFSLYHDVNGNLAFDVIDECEAYADCEGTLYGSAIPDCLGECAGTAQIGDLSGNETQELEDAELYLLNILGNDVESNPCTDVNADSLITITDAAQLIDCIIYGADHPHDGGLVHNHCNFPSGYVDISDTVWLQIAAVNWEENYVDIEMRNPYKKIVGYQFNMSGLQILNVENTGDTIDYPVDPMFTFGGTQVLSLSFEDSLIAKNQIYKPLCRVYFFEESVSQTICIENIIDIVNENYSNVITVIENPCVSNISIGIQELNNSLVSISPNPFNESTMVKFISGERPERMLLIDISGRVVQEFIVNNDEILIEKGSLSPGSYFLVFQGQYTFTKKIIIQ